MLKGLKKLPKDMYVFVYDYKKISVKKVNHLGFHNSYEGNLCDDLNLNKNLFREIMINRYGALLALKIFKHKQKERIYSNELFFKNSTTAHKAIEWLESYIISQKLNPQLEEEIY